MGWLSPETKGFTVNPLAEEDFVPASSMLDGSLPRTRYPYGRAVRGGADSNVVMSPINWISRNFTEAELVMQSRARSRWQPSEDREIVELVEVPNPFYDGDLLWKATLTSFYLDGNAYWLKVRNRFGAVIQLWYLPHFLVEPKWPKNGSEFISHYQYRSEWGGAGEELLVRDVVHLRNGLDPWNVRLGMSPVKPILREVFTDEEAANFSASILRNMGVPGGVIAPKDSSSLPKSEDVQAMKDYMKSGFTGDRRGEWLVLGTPTETSQFGFDPQALMLGNLRDIAEERVCAALGIPAAVVGFGAGLQQTKVGATMKELRRLAWTSCIEPTQRSLARQLTSSLVPEFVAEPRQTRLRFDTSMVPAFQEEETERARRIALVVQAGLLRVDHAQAQLGMEPDESQAVYLRPTTSVAVEAGEAPVIGLPAPSANGSSPDARGDEIDAVLAHANRVITKLNGSD